jgi:hypothetical protein
MEGLQFDRVGALWMGAVEVLRTTTPEPGNSRMTVCNLRTDAVGISWFIEKDLTEYSVLFSAENNITLSVLNIVNSKYTGNSSYELAKIEAKSLSMLLLHSMCPRRSTLLLLSLQFYPFLRMILLLVGIRLELYIVSSRNLGSSG